MKRIISQSDFRDAFTKMGRKDQFTYNGLTALFEYLERSEEDTGEEMELDVIALCCEYTEYDSVEEAASDYDLDDDRDLLQQLQDNTPVIEFDGGIIIQQY